jgi:transposase
VLNLPPSVSIFVHTEPTDMRKQFDGLAALVRAVLDDDPLSGHLYVFFNRAANRVKILWYDRGGFAMYCKRLERGKFHFPKSIEKGRTRVTIDAGELALILEGIDLRGATWRTRWDPPQWSDLRGDRKNGSHSSLQDPESVIPSTRVRDTATREAGRGSAPAPA